MVKLYYNPNDYDSAQRAQLFPLLKAFVKGEGFSDADRERMYGISSSDYQIVDTIAAADIVILTMSWNYYLDTNTSDKAFKVIEETDKYHKTIWSFVSGDFGVKVPEVSNMYVFRLSGERSKLPKSHIGIPALISDPLVKHFNTDTITIPKYTYKPSIGFCGQSNVSTSNRIKETLAVILRNLKHTFGFSKQSPQKIQSTSYLRNRVLTKIKQVSSLNNNFIERKAYRGGAKTAEERQKTIQEFYDNINTNQYTVCVRGAGNFSIRFFETLAMGRIPIFINTDCLLPLPEIVDWKQHVVWIEEDELHMIETLVNQFHNTLGEKGVEKLCKENRVLWENKLNFGTYFKLANTIYKLPKP